MFTEAQQPERWKDQAMPTISASEKSNASNWMSAGFNIYGAYDLGLSALEQKLFDPCMIELLTKIRVSGHYQSTCRSDPSTPRTSSREAATRGIPSRAHLGLVRAFDVSAGAFSGHVQAAYGQPVSESSQYSYANMRCVETLGSLVIHGLSETHLTEEFIARF
jgi:hypothetical protein